jgi:hypothetical protein
MLLGLGIGFVIGFIAAYGFDTWLQYRDDREWR